MSRHAIYLRLIRHEKRWTCFHVTESAVYIQYNTVVVVVNSYSDPERSEDFSFFFGTNDIILQNITFDICVLNNTYMVEVI